MTKTRSNEKRDRFLGRARELEADGKLRVIVDATAAAYGVTVVSASFGHFGSMAVTFQQQSSIYRRRRRYEYVDGLASRFFGVKLGFKTGRFRSVDKAMQWLNFMASEYPLTKDVEGGRS